MVLPGHVATATSGGWSQTPRADWHVPVLRDRRPGAYAEHFRNLFDQAVRCRVDSATEVGVSLSGGLDSTSVIATAAATAPEVRRTALCLGLEEPAGDERELQRLVASRTQSAISWVKVNGDGPFGADGPEALL